LAVGLMRDLGVNCPSQNQISGTDGITISIWQYKIS